MRQGVKLSFLRLCFDNTVNLYRLSRLYYVFIVYLLFTFIALWLHTEALNGGFFFWKGDK